MSEPADFPPVGTRCHVEFNDCCVAGEFTSIVAAVRCDSPHPDDVDFVTAIEFANGVTLTEFNHVEITVLAGAS